MRLGFSTGIGNSAADPLLKIVETPGIRRSKINLEDDTRGNGVDGGSTLNGAHVQRCTRVGRQRNTRKRVNEQCSGDDGIGGAEVAPGMSARTFDDDLETPAAESFRDDIVDTRTVKRNEQGHCGSRPILHRPSGAMAQALAIDVAHPMQISVALLSDIGEKEQRQGRNDSGGMKG